MSKDKVDVEGKKWEFDADVAECFDDMLQRSIPDYDNMRDLVVKVGSAFVKYGFSITDIGCSNGLAIEPFVKRFGDGARYYLYDVSEPMLKKAREKFSEKIDARIVTVEHYDITQGIPTTHVNGLILSILTLQFTPIEYRQKIVKSVFDALPVGGAFILVEKVLGNTADIDDMMVHEYYGIKSENAYTEKQIRDKRKSLEGVLVPVTARWNEDLLREAGFRQIDCFWRYLNFAGWVAIK